MPRDFEAGSEAFRALAQGGRCPTSCGSRTRTRRGSRWRCRPRRARAARLRRATCGCAARAERLHHDRGWEGDRESVARRRALAARDAARRRRRLARPGRRARLGARPLRGPYLRDDAARSGVFVETLETSHTWSRLGELYAGVGGAIARRARRPGDARARHLPRLPPLPRRRLALLHLHRPRRARRGDRAVAGGQDGGLRGDRRRAGARSPTTTRSAATTPPTWRPRSASSGIEALRAVKERLDPAGIMNPGKLLG